MSLQNSYLSQSKYGYDYVVSTTQESINSGLLEYLSTINTPNQPTTYLCFLVDKSGNPSNCITLEQVIKDTGINPFEIPNNTSYDDSRITKLTEYRFCVGIKMKLGLPPGIMPKDMPPVVNLGSSANNVKFNLFCSEFDIIQNNPPSGWGGQGSWVVNQQPVGKPWYFTTNVNLQFCDLDNDLNTPYFNNHPEKKENIKNKLVNISSTAFSLQQLLFDLDNASLMNIPQIENVPKGSKVESVLTRFFIDYYFDIIKSKGEPVLQVHAILNSSDLSSLKLTGIEREVNQLLDDSGVVIENPTSLQEKLTTLNYLCAVNNNNLPGIASFNWNWVEPMEIDSESGVIAINRNCLANYYKNQLINDGTLRRACVKPWTSVTAHAFGGTDWKWNFTPYQMPQNIIIPADGPEVLSISFESDSDSNDRSGATGAEFDIHSSYNCSVSFVNNTVIIVQNIKMWLKMRWDDTSESANVVDKTITDTYTLSVGADGQIESVLSSNTKDNSQTFNFNWFVEWFAGIGDCISAVTNSIKEFNKTSLNDIPVNDISNFIFPAGNVFAFKDVKFSDHQDLVTKITYVKPN